MPILIMGLTVLAAVVLAGVLLCMAGRCERKDLEAEAHQATPGHKA